MLAKGAFVAIITIGAATAVLAQDVDGALQDKVVACRSIDKDKARLKCFDDALDEVLGVDETLQERREELREDSFGRASDDDVVGELSATIVDSQTDSQTGRTVVLLDNGQVWQTTSSGTLRRGFKAGAKVTIKEGSFGSYQIYVEGKKGFRGVKRWK